MPLWSELTHKQFIGASNNTEVAVLVTGALEAHGEHLPLGTDTILPEYLAKRVAERTKALVLPPIPVGNSWIFNTFEGTVSITPQTLIALYTDVMRAVFNHGFRYIVVLNGHGGNVSPLQLAAQTATEQSERVVIIVNWWIDLGEKARREVLETYEGHAAEDETSEVMHVRPDLVDMSSAVGGRVESRFRVISAAYREELYPSAVWGDPKTASAEKGKVIMEAAEEELVRLIEELERGVLPIKH
ncbi:MAG: creatininase family protein [Candidatus Thorarchaeota archaeon]|nr:MAG: creatininase family protein [Candidatus Thorarchaeota archaeon]